MESGGQTRQYLVHLPAKFLTTQSYPVILGFAGKGGSMQNAEATSQFDTLPVIGIYPQALIGKDGKRAWQGAPYSPDVDDVGFIRDILNSLEVQLCIQKPRIYSAGLSNGGGMSWVLSCQLSDRIAAFAMFAGAFYYPESNCKPARAAAILNVHGDADTTVPYGGSALRRLPDIDSWIAERARNNKCKTPPSILHTTATTTITTWTGCINDATVRNVRLHGAGHVWPEHLDFANGSSNTVSSAQSLLDFFLAHPLY
jgi:polyhydroxybutyrate depolymerase